jgi:flagellar biosynthesis protein FliR
MISLLLTTLVLGLVNRMVPRWNVLAVGFSLNAAVAIGVLALSAGSAAWFFQEQAAARIEQFETDLGAASRAQPRSHGSQQDQQ